MKLTLGKNKKLKSKKAIEALFVKGASIRKGALRLKYLPVDGIGQHKVAFSVPKRFFKRAVHRNRVKRLLRESYRLQQHQIKGQENKTLHLMWIYQSNKLPDQLHINQLMQSTIQQLQKNTGSPNKEP